MENIDERLEQAAASLVASPLKVLFTVTALLAPGLFGAGCSPLPRSFVANLPLRCS